MPKITPNYMEMKATDLGASKAFYEKAFGFDFTDYGPEYAAVEGGPVEIGLATGNEPPAPMPTFETDDLEAALAQVKAAQGEIVKDSPAALKLFTVLAVMVDLPIGQFAAMTKKAIPKPWARG